MQHDDDEYGVEVGKEGQHTGGPFYIDVSPLIRVEDLRLQIQVSASCLKHQCASSSSWSLVLRALSGIYHTLEAEGVLDL